MSAVQIGQRLRRHLGDLHLAERRLNVPCVHPLVAVDRVRRAALACELDDPFDKEVVECGASAGVPTLARPDKERCPCLLRLAQVAPECSADLPTLPGDQIAPDLDDELPHPRRTLAHTGRRPKRSHGRTLVSELGTNLERSWMAPISEPSVAADRPIIPGRLSGAGG